MQPAEALLAFSSLERVTIVHRPTFALLIVALAACVGLGGCSRGTPDAKNAKAKSAFHVAMQCDWLAVAEHGGYYQALAKGYYSEAGLDCEVLSGGPGTFVTQLVVTGKVAFAMGGSDEVMLAVQQGLPLVIVSAQMEHDPHALMLHENDPVHSFHDLDGRTIAASPEAAWIDFLKKQYGINFNLTPLDYGMARFAADPKLIQQCFVSSEPFFLAQKGVPTRTLLIADSGYDPYRVIYTNAAFAREHPEIVRAFVAASIRGWNDFLDGDATPGRALIAAKNPESPAALMDFSIEAMRRYQLISGDPAKNERTGLLRRERFETQESLLLKLGILKAPIDIDKFVRFDFAPANPASSAP